MIIQTAPADTRRLAIMMHEHTHAASVYALAPYPFAADGAEFAFAGRPINPEQCDAGGSWATALAESPTVRERFRLVAG